MAAVYPDSTDAGTTTAAIYTDASDVVSYAYNALGQEIYTRDQAGNTVAQEYDTAGRITARKPTAVTGFDNTVRRIAIAYVDRGMVDTVTQYDAATGGNVLDQVGYTYDGWSGLTKFEQDVDSAIGGSGQASTSVQYALAKSASTSGRRTLRRTQMTMPGGDSVDYYYSADTTVYGSLSRVLSVKVNSNTVATYYYMGTGTVVRTDLPEPLLKSEVEDAATVGSYPGLDRFNRVTNSTWTKVLSTPQDFYNVQIGYDRSSNITWTTDKIHLGGVAGNHRFDVAYTLDGLHRLTKAEEGEVSGGAYSSNRRVVEEWGLSQTGNFSTNGLSLDGNTTYTDTGDINDARTHNTVNEITQWRPDGTNNLSPTYDAAGNMTNDGRDYGLKYDALGRLVSVSQNGGATKLVTEYRYNGLGYRIGWHYDADADGTVESTSDDPWVYQTFDERWRVVATYIADQSTPKEQFYHHAAGLDGYGGSSYIDSVILRDRDMTDASGAVKFTAPGDGTLEERVYYCQNWRADVSALVDYTSGACLQLEHDKYLSYGTPWGLPAGDLDSDGDYDINDEKDIDALILATGYDVRADADLDGAVTAYDKSGLSGSKITLGRGLMSDSGTFNRRGYAGYDNDGVLGDGANPGSNTRFWHVRHRVLDSTMGRWTRRDPAGYVDGMNCFNYVRGNPLIYTDSSGMQCEAERMNYEAADQAVRRAFLEAALCWIIPPPGDAICFLAALDSIEAQTSLRSAALRALNDCLADGSPGNGTPRVPGLPGTRDPGSPPPIWVDIGCKRESTTFRECSRCCFRNYASETQNCLSKWVAESTKCDGFYFFTPKRAAYNCYEAAYQRMRNCWNQSDWDYRHCEENCDKAFPGGPPTYVPGYTPPPSRIAPKPTVAGGRMMVTPDSSPAAGCCGAAVASSK